MSSVRTLATVAALFAGVAPAGCKNISFGSESDDTIAKTFAVAPGRSAIYVVRPDPVRNLPLAVVLDDKLTARTGPCTYVLWEVDPGAHQILAYGENIGQLALTTEAGKTYFVRQDVAGGLWSPRTLLMAIEDAAGRKSVSDCRLIDTNTQKK